MSNRKDAVNGTDSNEHPHRLGRRRLMQIAGVTTVGSAYAMTGSVAAAPSYPNRITFTGTDASAEASYAFDVSDGLQSADGSVENGDQASSTSASGTVTGDEDAYQFAGTLTSLDVTGAVQVTIDYNDVTAKQTKGDRLEIVTPSDGSVEYEFVTTEEPAKVFDNGKRSAERRNDSVTQNDDGTWTVTGLTGNGYGDTFDLAGDVTSFDPKTGDYTLFVNGTQVTVDELLTTSDGSNDSQSDSTVHLLEVKTPANGSVEYSFTASGEITKVLDNGDNSAEPNNDSVTQNDDGTWTVTGLTGNGYGDTLEFRGTPEEFTPTSGDFTLYVDGEETTVSEFTGQELPTYSLKVVAGDDASVDYTMTASNEIRKSTSGAALAEDSDTVTQNNDGSWTLSGHVENGWGDSYEFDGEALEFSPMDGDFTLYVNGKQTTTYDLLGEEPPKDDTSSDTSSDSGSDGSGSGDSGSGGSGSGGSGSGDGSVLGGGAGYDRTVTRSGANIVARSMSEIEDALSAASSGEVVFVPGDEKIDFTNAKVTVPSGVTLASNRGVDDAPGALLHSDSDSNDAVVLRGSGRVTGIRFRGAHPGSDTSGDGNTNAVEARGNCEIDNTRIWGFAYAGIVVESGSPHVHHNVIVENNRSGLGYGVSAIDGDPIIEYNYFNYNRHSVAQGGDPSSYTCRYNHFGPKEVLHNIDVHQPAGSNYDIHNNVVETIHRELDGNVNHIISIRDVPDNMAVINDNWFFNSNAPSPDGPTDSTGQVIIQPKSGSWQNVSFSGNHYGKNANIKFADIIPGYDGSWSN